METITVNAARVYKVGLLLIETLHTPEGWVAGVCGLPGCVTQAETHEELLLNIVDAYKGIESVYEQEGEPIPWTADYQHWDGKGTLEWATL